MSVRVEILRRHATGESRGVLSRERGISLTSIARWFKKDQILRAAGLSKVQCADIGVEYLGPYNPADVLPWPDDVQPDAPPPVRLSPATRVKAKGGRPSALEDPAKLRELRECLELMMPLALVADSIGVTEATVRNWIKDSRSGKDTPGARLGAEIRSAVARGARKAHEMVLMGDPGAKGAQFLLSRVFKEYYSERIEQAIEHQDPMAELRDDELEALIAEEV